MDPSLPPVMCSEPPSDREEAFKFLLLTTSQRLSEHDLEQLAFLADPSGAKSTPLQLLKTLRNKGRFCPFSGSRLEELLRTIDRHDLADRVKEYVERFPDRHRSMEERVNTPMVIPKKRSVTDLPPNVQSVSYNYRDLTSERPVVQQEEGIEARSVLHAAKPPPDGSPRPERHTHQLSDSSFHYEPPSHPTAPSPRDYPAEYPPFSSHMYAAPGAHEHPPQRAFTSEQGLPHMSTPLPRSTSQTSQDPIGYYSADASCEGSLLSLQQPSSREVRIARTALQMAQDLLSGPSQETLSDQWYMSSQSSMGSSLSGRFANCSDPTTGYASFPSDTESRPFRRERKKYSKSCHGSAPRDPPHHPVANTRGRSFQHRSSGQRSYVEERRPSIPDIPPGDRHDTNPTNPTQQYPLDTAVQGLTMEDIQYDYREDNARPPEEVVMRERSDCPASARNVRVVEEVCSQSSDHTPPASSDSVAMLRPKLRRGVSELEQSRTPRASMYSETSEGTIVSPRTSFYGKESIDSDDHVSSARQSPQPTKAFQKEKSLWRKLPFFKGKSRHGSNHSFTWKVAREDLMKPVWRHEEWRCITRSHKFELDASLGKHNPKLSFNLYPCGMFEDSGKCVTMAIRISTSDKCPPLPPTSKVHLSLIVWDGEREDAEVNRRHIAEKLNMSMFYIHGLITHDQLKESHSKHFHLDIEVSCTGVAV